MHFRPTRNQDDILHCRFWHGKHVKIHAEISIFDFTLEPDKNTLSGHEHHSLILSVTLIFLSLHPECNSTIYRIQLWVNISRLQNSRWSICARWSQILHKEYIWNFICYSAYSLSMMTSWNGNIYVVIGPLCGEFTGHRWIPCEVQWRGALMFSLICD